MRNERLRVYGLAWALASGSAVGAEPVVAVLFRGETTFAEKVGSLALTPDQAHAVAGKFICSGKTTGFEPSPTMIVGDSYVFNVPKKRSIPLTGIYIDGNSGDFECRTSSRSVSPGSDGIRMSQFTRIEKIGHRAAGS